jgi:hypothetical protein
VSYATLTTLKLTSSQPKYWCKHCKTFVRDTKLEKTNHEATPKHQGNLKRFLKDLHRGHERDEKDKERAKSEVARLNGLVAGGGAGSSSNGSGFGRGPTPSVPKLQATAAQRKQQLAQLAEMGVSIPDEFRPDMAMAGDWQVTSERVLEADGETKSDAKALGVKRERVEEDDDAEAAEIKKKRWGSKFRTHPAVEDDADLDALLLQATSKSTGPAVKTEVKSEVKVKSPSEAGLLPEAVLKEDNGKASDSIKEEPLERMLEIPASIPPSDALSKREKVELTTPEVVFKKRKAKHIRQK